MRLVFDIQSLQSASRLRGIGRYTDSLISALIAEHQEHEIILLVNGAFSDDHPRLVADFEALYPGTQCVVCSLPGPSSAHDPENRLREAVSELMREAFVAELEPDCSAGARVDLRARGRQASRRHATQVPATRAEARAAPCQSPAGAGAPPSQVQLAAEHTKKGQAQD